MYRKIILGNVEKDLLLNISPEKLKKVKNITDDFLLTDDIINQINRTFEEELELGLAKDPARASSCQMANTFIPRHLDGDEKGRFLALDLGGTNFRVILLTLEPSSELQSNVQYYTVPESLRLGEGEKLFEFLADCIHNFLENNGLLDQKLPLGFCFSFPMIQTGLDEGILVTWTKSFNCPNVVGKEVVQMLRTALIMKKVNNVDIVAVINDTTGTLMMGSYLDKRSAIGLILGTGCNACYFEKVENIEKWEGQHAGIKEVIIDIEWGAFGDNGVLDFMKTDFDMKVDQSSLLVHSFTFEKLFAGKYIGQIVKQILLKMIDENFLFEHMDSKPQNWDFLAADISNTVEEANLSTIFGILKEKGFVNPTVEDAEIVHYVCTVVSVRGALIVSICLASLLRRMDKDDVSIAIDGSLFKHHPKYDKYMEKFIATLAPGKKFQLILAEDGSGKGAGLVAAVVTSLDKSQIQSCLHA